MRIKEKMVEFSTKMGEKTVDLTTKLGVADSNFRGQYLDKGINSDVIVRFLEVYPQCSAEWLLRDEGSMFRSGDSNTVNGVNNGHVGSTYGTENQSAPSKSCDDCSILSAKDQVIAAQQGTIEAQRIAIEALRR